MFLALCAASAHAAEPDPEANRDATVKLVNLLVEQGVISREKAEALLAELRKQPAGAPVRVPYMPEYMRKELKDEIQLDLAAQAAREGWAKAGSVPAWVRSLEWEGDVRTRYQYDNYDAINDPTVFNYAEINRTRSFTLLNTTQDRRRFRVRARAGLNSHVDDNWAAGLRLTTGNLTDPLSSNQTLGTYGNRFTTSFDRAYIRWRWEGVETVLGRFGNPWYGSDLVWANDLGFDGAAVRLDRALTPRLRGFGTVAAMPIQELEFSSLDKWMYGGQVGVYQAATAEGFGLRLGLGYYHYRHIAGQTSAPSGTTTYEFTAPQYMQKGNTLFNISADPITRPLYGLASDYHLVNLTGQVDFPAGAGRRMVVLGDYVRNVGYDRAKVNARTGDNHQPQVTGYQVRVSYGSPEMKKLHDWQLSVGYKRLERDAVLDAFTDSDFHLGGTDARGYILGATYGLGKNTSASLRYFSADSITGLMGIDVVQFDLNIRF